MELRHPSEGESLRDKRERADPRAQRKPPAHRGDLGARRLSPGHHPRREEHVDVTGTRSSEPRRTFACAIVAAAAAGRHRGQNAGRRGTAHQVNELRKSSTASAVSVCSFALPRAPSATDTRAIVSASGASTTLTKSNGPSVAHWCTTLAPSSSTSRLTSRSRSGFAFNV